MIFLIPGIACLLGGLFYMATDAPGWGGFCIVVGLLNVWLGITAIKGEKEIVLVPRYLRSSLYKFTQNNV